MVSVSAAFRHAYLYLCLAFAAVELSTFLDRQCGAGTATGTTTFAEVPLLHSAAKILPPLAAVVVLFVAVTLIYHHLMGRRVAVAVPVARAVGNGRRRSIWRLAMFALCVSAGTLEFIVFVQLQAAGGGGAEDHGALVRALGLAALHALPAAATVTFFCGMVLIVAGVAAHVRPGGEAGGAGAGAVAGDGPVQGLLRPLTKVAAGAAVVLVGLMATALVLHGATCGY